MEQKSMMSATRRKFPTVSLVAYTLKRMYRMHEITQFKKLLLNSQAVEKHQDTEIRGNETTWKAATRQVSRTTLNVPQGTCKLKEKVIWLVVPKQKTNSTYLSNYQPGFVYWRSCTIQHLAVLDGWSQWTKIMNHGGVTDDIYCNFAEAFVTVTHMQIAWRCSEKLTAR